MFLWSSQNLLIYMIVQKHHIHVHAYSFQTEFSDIIWQNTCKATFLASSGTWNPSCSKYFVSIMIKPNSGAKSATYCRLGWEAEINTNNKLRTCQDSSQLYKIQCPSIYNWKWEIKPIFKQVSKPFADCLGFASPGKVIFKDSTSLFSFVISESNLYNVFHNSFCCNPSPIISLYPFLLLLLKHKTLKFKFKLV